MRAVAQTSGSISGLGVLQPVTIVRDARGVPHIEARNEHDAYFAEGFVQGCDRLFQMDVTRRAVSGHLSEIFGKATLRADETARMVPVESIAAAEWARLPHRYQENLQAFADGVNAAMRTQPLPVEFRILLYRPKPWTPQASLVSGFGIVLSLTDTWNDILARSIRSDVNPTSHPLTDPCYDAPVTEGLARISETPQCLPSIAFLGRPPTVGSNEWAAGAAHTLTGRALLANDPHLPPGMPGVWYLVDIRYPGFHVAGATFAGVPGVLLGHNDRVAWGATNGTVTSLSVFAPPCASNPNASSSIPACLSKANVVTETFHVRFGRSVRREYYRDARDFGVVAGSGSGTFLLVRWDAYDNPISPFLAFDGLDRANSMQDALRALRNYPGPTQNFVIADTSGRVAYQLAGDIPDDPLWARGIHPASDLARTYSDVPFDRLPRVAPSRTAIVWTANNKMYGPGYPYRLSAEFAPPYRAYRIAQLLKARSRYDVAYFSQMQMDTLSLPERDLVRITLDELRRPVWRARSARHGALVNALRSWDGRYSPGSRAATVAYRAQVSLTNGNLQRMSEALIEERSARFYENLPSAFGFAATNSANDLVPWSVTGAMTPLHPLASIGVGFLNGVTFPGDGDNFTIHVQSASVSQSFRAVWDMGNWDAGGISIPEGESGEPGSAHYTDEAKAWITGTLQPLPYSRAAVEASARERLTLLPQ